MNKDLIIPMLVAKTKKEALKELVDCVVKKESTVDSAELLRVLLEREELGSTGIGDGIAIPHGKIKKIENLIVSFGRSLDGVDFHPWMENQRTLFSFLLLQKIRLVFHLKALARISRLLKDSAFRRNIMGATTSQEIYDIIAQKMKKY